MPKTALVASGKARQPANLTEKVNFLYSQLASVHAGLDAGKRSKKRFPKP